MKGAFTDSHRPHPLPGLWRWSGPGRFGELSTPGPPARPSEAVEGHAGKGLALRPVAESKIITG
jgi:hypothetical protein